MGYCTTEGARPIGKLFHLFRPKVLYEKSYRYLPPLLRLVHFGLEDNHLPKLCRSETPRPFNPSQFPLGLSRRLTRIPNIKISRYQRASSFAGETWRARKRACRLIASCEAMPTARGPDSGPGRCNGIGRS